MRFYKEYKNFTLKEDHRLELTLVESEGSTLEELLENCLLYLTDWHGNEGPARTLGDLSDTEIEYIVDDIKDAIYTEEMKGYNR